MDMEKTTCAIIDNYDSFTYNLVHLVREIGVEVSVFKNDALDIDELQHYDKIILSPGPGIPSEAGKLLTVIQHYAGKKPILGVCLGHQAIAEVYGGTIENLLQVYHGAQTKVVQTHVSPIFDGLDHEFLVGRYHSWIVSKANFPTCLEVIAESNDGQIMAFRHKQYNVYGIQFHPESILTPSGKTILTNWLTRA